jgi:hypothetical protein
MINVRKTRSRVSMLLPVARDLDHRLAGSQCGLQSTASAKAVHNNGGVWRSRPPFQHMICSVVGSPTHWEMEVVLVDA